MITALSCHSHFAVEFTICNPLPCTACTGISLGSVPKKRFRGAWDQTVSSGLASAGWRIKQEDWMVNPVFAGPKPLQKALWRVFERLEVLCGTGGTGRIRIDGACNSCPGS